MKPVLQQVVAELRYALPDRLIETDFRIAEPVNCDRSRIGQLASNLIGNALTHGAPDMPARIYASTDNGMFELSLQILADPISTSAMEHLFQPLFRGKVRASLQGLGLGLHIATEIAKAHEGSTLTVKSDDVETRFTFLMPLMPPP